MSEGDLLAEIDEALEQIDGLLPTEQQAWQGFGDEAANSGTPGDAIPAVVEVWVDDDEVARRVRTDADFSAATQGWVPGLQTRP